MKDLREVNFFKVNSARMEPLNAGISMSSEVRGNNFKDVLGNMMVEMNEATNKPQQLTEDMMQGKADVHDVMTAIAKSEMTVQIATTVTGKILQTYEKIMQIQI